MTITERMAATLEAMNVKAQTARRSVLLPRVFFLTPDDYAEYVRTGPDYDWRPFYKGGVPSEQFCPLYAGLPVRQSNAAKPTSRLFSHAGTSMGLRS